MPPGQVPRDPDNPGSQVQIKQKMLPEFAARTEAVPGDDLTERRLQVKWSSRGWFPWLSSPGSLRAFLGMSLEPRRIGAIR